jgi:hypothetical protein
MTKVNRSRLLIPAIVFGAGSVIAVALRVGHTWQGALITEVATLVIASAYFVTSGRDSDAGAIYGQRSDERQAMIRLQASRLGFIVMMCAAFVCVVVTVAANDNYWQADVIGSLGALTFLFSLVTHGAHNHLVSDAGRGVMDANEESGHETDVEHLTKC